MLDCSGAADHLQQRQVSPKSCELCGVVALLVIGLMFAYIKSATVILMCFVLDSET